MTKLVLKVFILAVVVITWQAKAETNFFNLEKQLNQPDAAIGFLNKTLLFKNNIQGDFSQEKQIKVLSRPLRSSGAFTLGETEGLIWDTQFPIQNRIKVNTSGLYEWRGKNNSSGTDQWRIKPESQSAGFSRYAKSFQALLNADIQQLQQNFELYWQNTTGEWSLGLKPKQTSPLNKLISWIKVSGSDRVTMIQILEQSGDFSKITLSSVKRVKNATSTDLTAK